MKDARCLSISDIHLGHTNNTAREIINNLDIFFDHYTLKSQFTDLDIIFLAGDVYDRLLDFYTEEVQLIQMWMGRLMSFCNRFDIKLRILEGTPSHDWKQSKNFETVYNLLGKPFDFKYIPNLHIEYMQDLDCHVLYVPDEWPPGTESTLKQIKELMRNLQIDQVDIACMHGAFKHQLPPAAHNTPIHDAQEYLSIVKHYITIGHVHHHTVFERILAQGSFDRIAHGEEAPKGAVLFTISESKGNTFSFIENKGAKTFKSIKLKHSDIERSIVQIDKALNDVRHDSFIRIIATKTHPLYVAFDQLKLKFPMFTFSRKNVEDIKDEEVISKETVQLNKQYVAINIDKQNIVGMIMHEVQAKHDLTADKHLLLKQLLEKTL